MALDPLTWGMILSGLGSALGGIFGGSDPPQGTNMGSFEGQGRLDPRAMLGGAVDSIQGLSGPLFDLLGQDVNLRGATVQQPGVFYGGGLPMGIGLSGMDPALSDSSILTLPGLKMGTGNTGIGPSTDFSFQNNPVPGTPSEGDGQPPVPPEKPGGPHQQEPYSVPLNLSNRRGVQDAIDAFDLLGYRRK